MGNFVKKYNRQIDRVVIHCTGSSLDSTPEAILNYWKNVLGWKYPGYHKLIDKYGKTHQLALPTQVTNGVTGYNWNSYHISWIGGHQDDGDNRTPEQKAALYKELKWCINEFGKNIDIVGHRDLSLDKDGNGIISPDEWTKQCPSFDVISFLNSTGLYNTLLS